MAVAKNITSLLNLLTLLCSVPIIAAGLWLEMLPADGCININFRWPLLCIGILILLVSLAGFRGANRSETNLFAFYLYCIGFFIALLLVLLICAFVDTQPDGSYRVPGKGYKEYRLDGYSSWVRHHVVDSKNWNKIRSCLVHTHVCLKLTKHFITGESDQFFASHLSPLHSGCCKPPTICGYTFVNPTLWTNASNPTGDPDCKLWSNDQTELCYNCNSCKAGLLGDLRTTWMIANIIVTVSVAVLICAYIMACFRHHRTETRIES